jgi:capsular polysaccharide biosynthesis protein
MEIKALISLMWRNLLYLILGLALGAILGLIVAKIHTPVYEATTKILISRTRQQSNADMLPLSDEQLVAINLQLAKSQSVLDEITQQVGAKADADSIQVSSIPNTLIVQIKVQDTDPARAAQIANTLVQILIQRNEDLLSGRYAAFEQAIDAQIAQVQAQIVSLQTQVSQISDTGVQDQLARVRQQIGQLNLDIAALKQDISAFPLSPAPVEQAALAEKQAQLEQLNSLMSLYRQIETNLTYTGRAVQGDARQNPQLATLQATLDLYQQMYLGLLSNRETTHLARMQSSENVVQIVPAIPPKKAAMPIPILYMLVGLMAGLTGAATIILTLNHFDTSLRTPAQAEQELQIPVLGLVPDDGLPHSPVALSQPYSAEADAFRALGASVEIISLEGHIRALLVLNGGAKDGKTCIAANLAVVNAQQGRRVTLVDGDLKRPRLHDLFGVEN